MIDSEFRQWLTARSWGLMVRYCRVVGWLLPIGVLAKDIPLWLSSDPSQLRRIPGLLVWQGAIAAVVYGVVAADRFLPRVRGREIALYVACGLFMAMITWAGVTGVRTQGTGLLLYAACSTFMAAVIATPLPVRAPMYVLSLAALSAAAWERLDGLKAFIGFMVNPFCVVMLCLGLDRFTYARDSALYGQTRRAEAERARADEVLHNALPPAIAEELKQHRKVRARKFDNLGVLFADIAGFTEFSSRLPPDALVLVLDEIFSAFDALSARHGVEKIKTIGDAYMAVSSGSVGSLCRLALDMREALEQYNREKGTEMAMRIGIHAGPAVAGVLGVQRFLYDVWGDTVNVASRLESTGHAGGIQVSEAVVRQAGDAFAFHARGLVELRGRGRLLTYWLVGVEQARAVA
ncbi:adenylate/guanylate cyclase domain-containing protein [Ramlibacter henchirensis]|uniref:Adenylate/guanylate cyclase domain-containing protein n=1 Tax=Ramlibacter henchirensis TaxID=204072 RepID=A0A4Z0C7E3_9BURK|nr:adenylate/guanylate cyclase domain-containing protein [Ramlibacter henchirensis]TFZ06812.1 adenylate/guanylate cyclase domain-containing protein [Ramlibacter henchirensis]